MKSCKDCKSRGNCQIYPSVSSYAEQCKDFKPKMPTNRLNLHRLTTDKAVSDMSMTELAHNSCYAKDRKARYRDYDMDMDARQLAIKLLIDLAGDDGAFTCDEDFDEWIADYMQCGLDSIHGLIAVFYTQLWAMADLRERLMKYENMHEKIIKRIEEIKGSSDYPQNFKGQMAEDFEWVLGLLN